MQKDEEVGKVAQATPVVISKALELFLGMIVDEANQVTAERGSKRVEAYHLKHAIERTDMLDFLKEIVESVPDPSAGGTIDIDAEKADGKKKRGPPRRRKKKGGAEADEEAEGDEEKAPGVKDEDLEDTEEEGNHDEGRQASWREDDEWHDDEPHKPR